MVLVANWENFSLQDLLYRAPPFDDESEFGYLLRLAERNGLSVPARLFQDVSVRGHSLLRYCPCCLDKEASYWRSRWQDSARPWCEIHQVWLADTCAACGTRKTWRNTRLTQCKCGAALSLQGTASLSPALAGYLVSDRHPLQILLWFGAISTYGLTGKPMKEASMYSMAKLVPLIEEGFRQTQDWPNTFLETLQHLRRGTPQEQTLQLFRSAFPRILPLVKQLRNPEWQARVLSALREYVLKTAQTPYPITGRQSFLLARSNQKAVATRLGVRTETLAQLLATSPPGNHSSRVTARGRVRRVIPVATVEAIGQTLQDRLTVREAALLAGIPEERITQLIASGHLAKRDRWLSRKEFALLVQTCSAKAITPPALFKESLNITETLRRWIPMARTGQFFEGLKSGAIRYCSLSSATGFTDIAIDEASLRTWRTEGMSSGTQHFSIPQAAIQLGLKQEVVYDLVNHGFLNTEIQMLTQRRARTLSADEIARFTQEYVSLTELAAGHGITSKLSVAWAMQQGLQLVTGPSVDGTRQYFLRRTQLLR